jgi:hypothetical protein
MACALLPALQADTGNDSYAMHYGIVPLRPGHDEWWDDDLLVGGRGSV